MRTLITLILIILFSGVYAQSNPQNEKKLNAVIAKEYTTYASPIEIDYKIYPYGGSGQYSYRWKGKKGKFTAYSTNENYHISFNCNKEKRPEVSLICQVKDDVTGKTFTTVLRHPVEYCITN